MNSLQPDAGGGHVADRLTGCAAHPFPRSCRRHFDGQLQRTVPVLRQDFSRGYRVLNPSPPSNDGEHEESPDQTSPTRSAPRSEVVCHPGRRAARLGVLLGVLALTRCRNIMWERRQLQNAADAAATGPGRPAVRTTPVLRPPARRRSRRYSNANPRIGVRNSNAGVLRPLWPADSTPRHPGGPGHCPRRSHQHDLPNKAATTSPTRPPAELAPGRHRRAVRRGLGPGTAIGRPTPCCPGSSAGPSPGVEHPHIRLSCSVRPPVAPQTRAPVRSASPMALR